MVAAGALHRTRTVSPSGRRGGRAGWPGIVDKHGARPALLGGAVFLTAALLGMAYVSELWHVYLAFPLLGIGFACIHTVTIGKIVSRWFLAKRTRAMASATFGAGFGGALLVPLNVLMIQELRSSRRQPDADRRLCPDLGAIGIVRHQGWARGAWSAC